MVQKKLKQQNKVFITEGEMVVPEGDSGSAENLTLSNNRMIFRFASNQKPPWGMPKGGIIDAAAVVDGKPQSDLITLFDFLPDNWSSWPNTYHHIDVVENSSQRGIIKVERDWCETRVSTIYSLSRNAHVLEITTTITNKGSGALNDIYPGYTLSLKGGHMYTPPGLNNMKKGDAKKALGKIFIGYDENRFIALHAPYCTYIDHFGQDMLTRTSLLPNESKTFSARLQICPHSDISKVLPAAGKQNNCQWATLSGRVVDNSGNPVPAPFIVVKKEGHVFTWSKGDEGEYSLTLPQGDYALYAVAKNYSASDYQAVSIDGENDSEIVLNFSNLAPPGEVTFIVTSSLDNKPLDARITIKKGHVPEIGFLGRSDYFTELNRIGKACIVLSPGAYTFQISHSAGFTAQAKQIDIHLNSKEKQQVSVSIDLAITPGDRNWYAADFHHHGDVLDGVTSPEYVMRSQLSAGLDFAFLSDHDSNEKNEKMAELAAQRESLFIPAMEISPAWGHFNIFPVNSDAKLKIEPGTSTINQIFTEARRLGAKIIQINHPYSTYGYFRSLDLDLAPGGFDPDFHLIELNFQYPQKPVMEKIWELWNQGCTYYLGAGSDTHSVWQDVSGSSRMYLYLDEDPSLTGCIEALKAGNSYASFGPLVFPEIIFGNTISVLADEPLSLKFEVFAVNNIKEVRLICRGKTVENLQTFKSEISCEIEFSVLPERSCWYSLVILDQSGGSAYTNPIWVDVLAPQ